jgi:ABC-type phosphate transport system permease subunit
MSFMPDAAPKRENLLVNLACNVAVPFVLMGQLSKDTRLGPAWGLVVALLFPLGYGIYDFVVRRKANALSVIGFTGILLSGVLGLLKLGGFWFAVKDAAFSAFMGIALLLTLRSREPLVKTMFYNPSVMDVDLIEAALKERGTEAGLAVLLRGCTWMMAAAFFISGVIGFFLARYLLKSPGGTPEFNAELARLHLLGWVVIAVPAMIMMMFALWRFVTGLKEITGLTLDQILRAEEKK